MTNNLLKERAKALSGKLSEGMVTTDKGTDLKNLRKNLTTRG